MLRSQKAYPAQMGRAARLTAVKLPTKRADKDGSESSLPTAVDISWLHRQLCTVVRIKTILSRCCLVSACPQKFTAPQLSEVLFQICLTLIREFEERTDRNTA